MNKNNILIWAIFSFIAFFLVAINLNNVHVIALDSQISNFVISSQVSWLTSFCSILSVIFEPIYVVLFVLILSIILWTRKFRNESLFLVFVSIAAGALIFLLKLLFVRVRPSVQFLAETGYSFPSGHALISVVLFGSLIYFLLRIKSEWKRDCLVLFSYLGILALGLSRVYLNVHWFSDIFGGYFLGATILFVGVYLLKTNVFRKLFFSFNTYLTK